jgi:hypothetical protein
MLQRKALITSTCDCVYSSIRKKKIVAENNFFENYFFFILKIIAEEGSDPGAVGYSSRRTNVSQKK